MASKTQSILLLKLLGGITLLSAALHISLVFYHLSFGAESVVITEPNTLLVQIELALGIYAVLFAALLSYRYFDQLKTSIN